MLGFANWFTGSFGLVRCYKRHTHLLHVFIWPWQWNGTGQILTVFGCLQVISWRRQATVKQCICNFSRRSRASGRHFRANLTYPQTNCASSRGFEPASGMFGRLRQFRGILSRKKRNQPDKPRKHQKNWLAMRRQVASSAGFINSFAGIGLDHRRWLREKHKHDTENNRTAAKQTQKTILTCIGCSKQRLEHCTPSEEPFLRESVAWPKKKQHNREIKSKKTINKTKRPPELIESNRRSNRE